MGESFFVCAERETLEETGLQVKGVKVVAVTNDVFDAASKHYITIFVQCTMEDAGAQPKVSRTHMSITSIYLSAHVVATLGLDWTGQYSLSPMSASEWSLCLVLHADEISQTMEPNKCEGWHWMKWDEIRQWSQHHDDTAPEWADKKCFLPIRNLVKDHPGLDISPVISR